MDSPVKIRKATLDDSKFLLEIYNASVKGGYFSSQSLVNLNSHIVWYNNKLNSKESSIYIGLLKKEKARFGYVRFDKVEKNSWEVSMGNLPNFYSKGFGTLMLDMAIKKINNSITPKKVIACIKKNNIRSQKCFIKNDFIKIPYNSEIHFTVSKFNLYNEYYYELYLNR